MGALFLSRRLLDPLGLSGPRILFSILSEFDESMRSLNLTNAFIRRFSTGHCETRVSAAN